VKKNTLATSKKAAVVSLLSGSTSLATQGSLKLGNVTYTAAAITKVLRAYVDAFDANIAEQAKAKSAHQAAVDADLAASPLVKLLDSFVRAMFGNDAEVLTDFGLAPRKAGTKTPAVLTQAAKKAAATRAARHTMGSVQKKSVTSNRDLVERPASPKGRLTQVSHTTRRGAPPR